MNYQRSSTCVRALRRRDLGYVLAGDKQLEFEEVPHTIVLEWDATESGWGQQDLGWTATAACVCDFPKQQLVAVGRFGHYLVLGQGDQIEGHIVAAKKGRRTQPFRGVRDIAGTAYAVGMGGQVYRRDGLQAWTRLDRGLPSTVDLEAIHGFAEDEIYAVGWKGALWRFDGTKWTQIDSPTNLILTGVFCADDGNVYVCGQIGTVLRGRNDRWETIKHNSTEVDFWNLEWFNESLYISSTQFLFTLEKDDTLKLELFGGDPPSSRLHLNACDGVMWSIGASDVMAFDGKNWSRIE